MDLKHIRELFEIKHSGRTLQVWRGSDGHRKQYIGAINGTICAIGPATHLATFA